MDGERRFTVKQVPGLAVDFLNDDFHLRTQTGLGDVRDEYPALYIYELEGASLKETEDFFTAADPALSPVFYERGGGLKALPGGVILIFKKGVSAFAVGDFLSEEGIKEETERLSWHRRGYFVTTPPGLESLHLANHLAAAKDIVEISSPNWWTNSHSNR